MIAKNKAIRLLLLPIGLAAVYIFGFRDSLSKVDAFCDAIDASVHPGDVKQIAEKFGFRLLGTEGQSTSGVHQAYVASAYTLGEYRCGIEATLESMVRKSMPDGTVVELKSELDAKSVQSAVDSIFAAQVEGGELAVKAQIQACYDSVESESKPHIEKLEMCVVQDIAYGTFARSFYSELAVATGKPQAEIQTPFTTLDAVRERARASLMKVSFSAQGATERIAELTQPANQAMTIAVGHVLSTRSR